MLKLKLPTFALCCTFSLINTFEGNEQNPIFKKVFCNSLTYYAILEEAVYKQKFVTILFPLSILQKTKKLNKLQILFKKHSSSSLLFVMIKFLRVAQSIPKNVRKALLFQAKKVLSNWN